MLKWSFLIFLKRRYLTHFRMKNKGKLIIYWDYELQRGVDVGSLYKKVTGVHEYNETEFIISCLKKNEINTCFAVLGIAAEEGELPYHAPEQIKAMTEAGHEVGSHTYDHKRISLLTSEELVNELRISKEKIEKVTKQKCISFVPPWNKPQRFLGVDFDIYPGNYNFRLSRLTHSEICSALRECGYSTYRNCYYNPFSKVRLSSISYSGGVQCIPQLLNASFDERAKRLVKKAIDQRGLAVVHGHPVRLGCSCPENRKYFIDFVRFITKYVEKRQLEVILPRDLMPYEDF
jgi:peptidoglycan/xylan/chitin deacetylase (PgdA/CDA1 family)